MKRIFTILLCLLLLIPFSASADEPERPSDAQASAVYLYHFDSETRVYEKNTDTPIPAGSTPKIMAGLLACEALSERMQETVTITPKMIANVAGYRLNIKVGDVLSIEELLYLALCGSYNDAYEILSHTVSGSNEAFVLLMNKRAAELGADQTNYTEVCGVMDTSLTTAHDVAAIASAACKNELYMRLSDTARYSFNGKTVHNKNELISSGATTGKYYNAACHGLSAGVTNRGGSCVVTVADTGHERYLCVVMGAAETENGANYGYIIANSMIKWLANAYAYTEVISPETVICRIPVTVSDLTDEVEIRTASSLQYFLPKGVTIGKEVTYSVRLTCSTLEAPVEEGVHVGYVAVLYNGKSIGTLPIYTAEQAERSGFIGSLKNLQTLTQSRVFISGTIFFCVTLTAWIVTEAIIRRRRRHKWDKYFSTKMTPSADALRLRPANTQNSHDNREKKHEPPSRKL